MKAVQINVYGGNEVLEINQVVREPQVKEGQLLVEVYAASINPVDLAIRAGYLAQMAPLQFPATLGGDFAGVVKALGVGISDFNVGDEVYGQASVLNGGSGSFAQVLSTNSSNTALKPKNTNFEEASSLPLVGVSALQVIAEHIDLKSGQKILIHGGAGGVGSIAVQLAKTLGAYVATTVGTADVGFAKSLGADEVIDYKSEDFTKKLKDFDVVFSTVGGDVINESYNVLKKGGVLVSMLGIPDEDLAKEKGIKAIGQRTETNTQRLSRLKEYVESGKVKPQIDKVFPMDQAKEAFEYQEKQSPKGKVVLKIKE